MACDESGFISGTALGIVGTAAGELEIGIMGTVAGELELSVLVFAFKSGAAGDCDNLCCSVADSSRLVAGALLEEDGVVRGRPLPFLLRCVVLELELDKITGSSGAESCVAVRDCTTP